MEKAVRSILEKSFDKKHIKTRRGPAGSLSYIEGALVIHRLNEALEGEWDWEVLSHQILEVERRGKAQREVVVFGRLTAGGRKREAFGGSLTPNGEVTGDDLKAASTDALKKAASTFGVALDLYCDELPAEEAGQASARDQAQPGRAASEPSKKTALTTKDQRARLWQVAQKLGMDKPGLAAWVEAETGRPVAELTGEACTRLITSLGASLARRDREEGAAA